MTSPVEGGKSTRHHLHDSLVTGNLKKRGLLYTGLPWASLKKAFYRQIIIPLIISDTENSIEIKSAPVFSK